MTDDGWRPGAPGFPERRDEKMSELLPCPFCGGAMEEVTDEDGHYWVHPGRKGIQRADCWLADAWISDEPSGEGSIGEWNTRAAPAARAPTEQVERLEAEISRLRVENSELANRILAATARTSDILPLAEAGKRHAEGLSAQLDKPHWEPRRSHIEQARNSIKKLSDAILGLPPSPCFDSTAQPALGDIVSVKKGTPYFHDWRGVEMKLVSLHIDPEGKFWASVIDKSDPDNTRHRDFGVYDGETTYFELDHLERVCAVSRPNRGQSMDEAAADNFGLTIDDLGDDDE